MCLKKIGLILSKSYKVEDLYIGLLGYVTEDRRSLHIEVNDKKYIKKYIIYKKVKFDYFDFVGQDIFTKKEYFFWSGNQYKSDTICRAVGNYAIFKSLPLEQFLSVPKEYANKRELLELYDKLNNPKIEAPKKEKTPITDSILKTILETNELVKNTLMDEEIKGQIVKELDALAQYYISEMIKLTEEESTLTNNNEYSIRMEVIKSLASIEMKIKNPNVARRCRLKNEYSQFKQELNG